VVSVLSALVATCRRDLALLGLQPGQHWHLLTKILVAGPFVAAVLAAREYLKGDREVL
jgi:hypothetical protein